MANVFPVVLGVVGYCLLGYVVVRVNMVGTNVRPRLGPSVGEMLWSQVSLQLSAFSFMCTSFVFAS